MTITYSLDVSGAKSFAFTKLLFRWRGSIYKLIKYELFIFASLYYIILGVSRYGLSEEQGEKFTQICLYFRNYLDYVPITFVLGFYVSLIVTRWWNIYMSLPWVDRMAVIINAYVHGNDERGRIIRRTLVRYLNLMGVLCLRCVCTTVKRRFPTFQHLVDAKLMTEAERVALESTNRFYGEYFIAAVWFSNLVAQARREGRILAEIHVRHLLADLNEARSGVGTLLSYDWISVPLVYTQVVVIATHTFFFGCLFGRQYLEQEDNTYWISKYFPLFTFLQLFFYMGWLKVAEVLINPLGDDDDDFEVNFLIDRNVCLGFLMVDDFHGKYPPLEQDPYWNDHDPLVPYTAGAAKTCIEPYLGSAAWIDVPENTQEFVTADIGNDENISTGLIGAVRKFTRKMSHLKQPSHMSAKRARSRRRRRSSAPDCVFVPRHSSEFESQKVDGQHWQQGSVLSSFQKSPHDGPINNCHGVEFVDIHSLEVQDHVAKEVSFAEHQTEADVTKNVVPECIPQKLNSAVEESDDESDEHSRLSIDFPADDSDGGECNGGLFKVQSK